MKICFFASAGSTHAERVAAGLARRGHEVCVVCHKPVTIPEVTTEVFRVPKPGLRHPRRWEGRKEDYLRGFLRRYDVVVWFFLNDWGFTPQIIQEGCFVASPRGSDIVCPPGEGPIPSRLIRRRIELLRHAHTVGVAAPRFARQVAEHAGLDVDRIASLPLGVDLSLFRPNRSAKGTDGVLTVGFLKGFREVYGARYLVEAIPYILDYVPGARFEFVGGGPQRSICMDLASELEVGDAIQWTPSVPHHEVPRLMARWDLAVLPSLCESFGVAALEASAMCLPVVASNVGGLPDTVRDGDTGILVPPESPSAIARAIVTLLQDPAGRQRMGEAGRAWVTKHYEWNAVLDRWDATLQQALAEATAMV